MSTAISPPTPSSTLASWILAARPKTLPAGAVPVIVGAAVAWHASTRAWLALPCLLCALCIQIGTNLFNDYYDAKKGADGADRLGPVRVTQSGLLSPGAVMAAAWLAFALAAACGLVVVAVDGWPFLVLGALCLFCGWLYTAGPFPLAYVGLGELFVFLFFGLVATAGTAAALHGTIMDVDARMLLEGTAVGALSTCLIIVNNLRDVTTDAKVQKNTLAVRFGKGFARALYALCIAVAALAVAAVAVLTSVDDVARMHTMWWLVWLPLLPLVLGVKAAAAVARTDGAALNPLLGASARTLLVFGVVDAAALVLSSW